MNNTKGLLYSKFKIEEIEILLKDLDNKGVFKYHRYDYDKILKLLSSLKKK